MQAAKIRNPKSIEAYTGNLVMKVQVSYPFCPLSSKLIKQAKLGGVTHQVPISELPGMVKGKTMLLGGNLGFVSF
jgi:eukaryotic translation initiation factor 2C